MVRLTTTTRSGGQEVTSWIDRTSALAIASDLEDHLRELRQGGARAAWREHKTAMSREVGRGADLSTFLASLAFRMKSLRAIVEAIRRGEGEGVFENEIAPGAAVYWSLSSLEDVPVGSFGRFRN